MRFILVDKVIELLPGVRARGYRVVPHEADYLCDHLPGYPVEPGVLLLEAMAQLGGRLVEQSVRHQSGRDVLPMLAIVNAAEFKRPVRPGTRLDLTATVVSIRTAGARVAATAEVEREMVASATLTYGLVALDRDVVGIGPQNLKTIRDWGRETWKAMADGLDVPRVAE